MLMWSLGGKVELGLNIWGNNLYIVSNIEREYRKRKDHLEVEKLEVSVKKN